MVRMINKARDLASRQKEDAPAAPVAPAEDIVLLREIRDSLKK
jgi:large conductance mechanosensitive channel